MADGDIIAASISSDGWSAYLTIEGWSGKQGTITYDKGSIDTGSGNVSFAVVSEGYSAGSFRPPDPAWDPDDRNGTAVAYQAGDIGTAEWGIRHYDHPERSDAAWYAIYRDVCYDATMYHVLAAHMMGVSTDWNNAAVFDYHDRVMLDYSDQFQQYLQDLWTSYAP